MSERLVFDLYQSSDAEGLAELFNRNRFRFAKYRPITAEDILFIFQCRKPYFTVVAKKKEKIIATVGVYPISDQVLAGKNQVYIGWFLVDMPYRLSYSVVLGLYKKLMEGLAKTDVEEILSMNDPTFMTPLYMALKCGFVILDSTKNDFGRLKLHNFTPALGLYAGVDADNVDSEVFFSSLPIVDKKEANKLQAKTRFYEKYIECDYLLDGAQVTLLFDVINAKIDGAVEPNSMKVYPDFGTAGRYIIENQHKYNPLELSVELIMEEGSGQEDVKINTVLASGKSEVIDCSKEVRVFKFKHNDNWFCLYPNRIRENPPHKEPIYMSSGDLLVSLAPSTGFISIIENEESLVSLIWPCATLPYLEGIIGPRLKNLSVKREGQILTIVEETDQVCLVRKCTLLENKMRIITTLTCKTEELDVRPISHIYAQKGVQGYRLRSGEKEMVFGASKIAHLKRDFYDETDYPYWDSDPGRFADFPVEEIFFEYPSATVAISIDKRGKLIDYAPIFTSTLAFDREKFLEEQVIEELEVCLTRRASNK